MKNLFKLTLCMALVVFASACSHQAWEEHYGANTVNVIDKTLKEAIMNEADLSQFAAYLEASDYLDIFDGTQSYTIWAPVNSAWENVETGNAKNLLMILKNHVSRYPYLSTDADVQDLRLRLMDNKNLIFSKQGDDYYFGAQKLIVKDEVYKNGILHKIEGVEPFVKNIYEYIQTTDLDSLNAFLQSGQRRVFNESQSLVLGLDSNGNTLYDSVFYEYNTLMDYMGSINAEDSSYTVLLPNNDAWKEFLDRARPYFNIHPFFLPLPEAGASAVIDARTDSLRDNDIKRFMLSYLSFSGAMTPEQIKQLGPMSTVRNYMFYNGTDYYIKDMPSFFEGAYDTYTELSNGVAYTTNRINLDESYWCLPITIEAEKFYNHYAIPNSYIANPDSMAVALQTMESYTRSLYSRDSYKSSLNDSISANGYLELMGRSLTEAPVIAFDLSYAETRSAVPYNIKVVFLPANLYNPKIKGKPIPMTFSLSYLNTEGGVSTRNYNTVRYTDPTRIDTVLVTADAEGNPAPFTFPYASALASLKITSAIEAFADSVYSRDMLIDCIILEPQY